MELFLVVGGFVALAVLAPRYGYDSREHTIRDGLLSHHAPARRRRESRVSAYEPAGLERLRDCAWSPVLAEALE